MDNPIEFAQPFLDVTESGVRVRVWQRRFRGCLELKEIGVFHDRVSAEAAATEFVAKNLGVLIATPMQGWQHRPPL